MRLIRKIKCVTLNFDCTAQHVLRFKKKKKKLENIAFIKNYILKTCKRLAIKVTKIVDNCFWNFQNLFLVVSIFEGRKKMELELYFMFKYASFVYWCSCIENWTKIIISLFPFLPPLVRKQIYQKWHFRPVRPDDKSN